MAEDDYDLGTVAARIDMGRHDGDLAGVFNAVRRRLGENLVELDWRITLPDVSFGVNEMSLAALEAAESVLDGRSWHTLNPEASATEYKALLVAYLSNDAGYDDDAVAALVGDLTMPDMVASIEWLESANNPKGVSAA